MKPRKLNILVLNGPNLNLLGEREPGIYGSTSLAEINKDLKKLGSTLGVNLRFYQRNGEGELVDILHAQRKWADALLINPAAYTHTSVAIRDAIAAVALPAIEIHLSDIRKREAFRKISFVRDVCIGRVMGKGPAGYGEALRLLVKKIRP